VIKVERSKLILWAIVAAAAAVIIWRVGFHIPEPGLEKSKAPTARAAESSSSSSTAVPADEKKAAEPNRAGVSAQSGARDALGEPNRPSGMRAGRMRSFDPNGAPGPGGEPNGMGGMRSGRRRPFDPNGMQQLAGESNGPFGMSFGMMRPTSEPNQVIGPGGEPMEMINLRDVEMREIIQKLAAWTGKVVIPSDEAMKLRVTIYAPERLPRTQALAHIYSALRMKGIAAEHEGKVIFLKDMKTVKTTGYVPTVDPNQPLASLVNKDEIVQRFIRLHNYRPTQMGALIQPLIGEHGYISADETTSTLLIIDTVSNLIRIEKIISEFDVPEAEQAVTQIFEIKHGGDPAEIVQLLRILLGVTDSRTTSRTGTNATSFRGGQQGGRFGGGFGGGPGMSITVQSQPSSGDSGSQSRSGSSPASTSAAGTATSVVVGQAQGSIILIPEPRRKWIIARASADTIKQIGEWVNKLDKEEPVESEYEVIPLTYADSTQVEQSVENALRDMPGMELMPSVIIEPTDGQIIVFGRKDLRELVKKIVAEIDIPAGQLETQHFKVNYADPDQIKTSLDEIYSQQTSSSTNRGMSFMQSGGFGGNRRTTSTTRSSDIVRVISYPSLKQITVIASPENLKKIKLQIDEWDKPLNAKEVKPRIIELHNSDPVQMADLLTRLFSQEDTGGGSSYIVRYIFSESSASEQKKKIVGALYGQLTFEDVPGTKKIIVISKIPEAYDVIEELVRELDKQEMGEVPKVIPLKYADCEDLAERLNAMFNQQGTTAPIRRSAQGLSSTTSTQSTSSSTTQSSSTSGTGTTSSTTYTPPWSAGRTTTSATEAPISNVIGKVRFIPDPHSKSILVLAPPEFMEKIEEIVRELDVPGKQVMVKAVIVEVKHSDVTSLGLQIASNTSSFGTLDENAITALNQLTQLDKNGAFTTTGTTMGSTGATITSARLNTFTTNVNVLVDFLIRKVHAKILNQQTLWTKDNGEANFFKGVIAAFPTSATSSATAGNVQNYEFQSIGMTLRVRPRITPEKNVDMILNIILSQLQLAEVPVNGQPVRTSMETTTNMIVQNGQTVMLGGILFQEDSKVQRKIPLLGDIPLAGGLFRHNEIEQSNNELIVFVTPFVIDESQQISAEATQEMAHPMERLQEVKEQLKNNAEQLEKPVE
jgi:general secretion pathway protein D